MIRERRGEVQAAHRASWPTFRVRSCGSALFAGDSAVLVKGQTFVLDSDPSPGNAERVHLPHPEILSSLEPGHTILIDDGKLRLRVKAMREGAAVTRGRGRAASIMNRKGVSLPDTTIPVAAMTEKDRSDLEAALDAGVDWIALSFVQRPEDVAEVKKVARGRALVMSKLEKPQAIARLDEIIEISDAVMVARGDLGVEMPLEKVPGIQKRIDAHRPQARQARRRRDPDARIDDHLAGPDPGRGLRRRDRRLSTARMRSCCRRRARRASIPSRPSPR